MYEIYAYTNGDPEKQLLIYRPGTAEYQVMAPKLVRELSKAGNLTFTMSRDHPQSDSLPKMRTVVSVHQDGTEIWRGRVLKHDADWLNRRAVYCEGALAFFNDSCITPFVYKGRLAQFLQHLVDAHNEQVIDQMKRFRLGTVSAALGDLEVEFGDADEYGVGEDYGSTWEIISKLVLQTFGGYAWCTFDADTGYNVLNYCDEAYEAYRQTAQTIEYGQNLLDLTETTDTNNLMTQICPVGGKHTVTETKWKWKILWWGEKYTESHEERYGITDTDDATVNKYLPQGWYCDLGEGYISNTEAVKKFGVVRKTMTFDTDSENATFAAGVQALQQNSAMITSYTIRAVDLVDAGYDTERLTFASFAHIISIPHSVDAIMLCTKLTEPLDDPAKKEYAFGMSRRTLTDRQVLNLGWTNLLSEKASASESYSESTLKQFLNYKAANDAAVAEAAKTATNFLEFSDTVGLTIGHKNLPGKKVVISNSAVKVISGASMVNITADGIEVTDGAGGCYINSGEIMFKGIRNKTAIKVFKDKDGNYLTSYSGGTISISDLQNYSAVLLTFESNKGSTWLASGGGAGPVSMVLPVNGKTYSMVYPWNTVHRRTVTVYTNRIVFGSGYERKSNYVTGNNYTPGVVPTTFSIDLESPGTDGWTTNSSVCVPRELYGFM